ncbi:MAG: hypothetical protein ABIA04_12295 [Pseudomonadota bacterium]
MHDDMKILFICTANMCRSPFAENLARKIFTQYNLNDFSFDSAGTAAENNCKAVKDAVLWGCKFDLDFKEHRSKQVSKELLDEAEIVCAMEKHHYEYLNAYFPEYKNKIKLLSEYVIGGERGFDILDPVGKKSAYYEKSFTDIDRCIRGLAEFCSEEY